MKNKMSPYHINAQPGDLTNRYIFLCGSDARAKKISSYFEYPQVQETTRGHHLYLGFLKDNEHKIPVAAISTGMGCPSEDIILNELYLVGGRYFLRVGTAGSLQPEQIKTGDIVVATAAVRDEDTSRNYIMPEYPAVASIEMVNAIFEAAKKLDYGKYIYSGIVHTKSSFYAREMKTSFLSENENYLSNLKKANVLATEMECSHLFVLNSLYARKDEPDFRKQSMLAGCILAIVSDQEPITSDAKAEEGIERAIALSLTTIKILYSRMNKIKKPK